MGSENKANSSLKEGSIDELITELKEYDKTYPSIKRFIDPKAKKLALKVYKLLARQSCHQSSWNDCFYIAVRFELDNELQKTAALNSVVSNGISGYFETLTHKNFDTTEALIQLGVPKDLIPPRTNIYLHTDYGLRKFIEKKFKIDLDNKKEIKKMQKNYSHSREVYLYDL